MLNGVMIRWVNTSTMSIGIGTIVEFGAETCLAILGSAGRHEYQGHEKQASKLSSRTHESSAAASE